MTWSNAYTQFLMCWAGVAVSDWLFGGVHYANWFQWIIVGSVLAIISIVVHMTLLDRLGHVMSFVGDTVVAAVTVWVSQFFLPGAVITWGGALGAGLLLGLTEIVMHRWIQTNRRQGIRSDKP